MRFGLWSLLVCVSIVATAPGCNGDGGTAGTAGNTETSDPTVTTTMATTGSSTSAGETSSETSTSDSTTGSGECVDGAEQCKNGMHEVCEDGGWVDTPCMAGEFCDEQSDTCTTCACDPGELGACVGDNEIDVCADDCSGFAPQPCAGNQVCVGGSCVNLVCVPNSQGCADDDNYQVCNMEGTDWGPPVPCDPGTLCAGGQCLSACEVAAQTKANVGCEFWAVDMANLPPRDTYVYAVAISNPSFTDTVNIEIYDRNNNNQEQLIINDTIAPRQVEVFNLSGSSNGQNGYYNGDAGFLGTGIALGRAFRIASDIPVIATQFNPIGGATGYTTDASLLLPTHTLGADYLHLSWDQGYGVGSALVVIATEDATTLTITPNVSTPAGMNGLPAMTAGQPTMINIDRYDYVQLSTGPNNQDLSSSVISSTAPVAVFGGHSCANVPTTSTAACDHVEEQVFPLETWGKNYIGSRNPQRGNEPMLWRILASEDNTTINFDPPVTIGPQVVLNQGELVQFQEQQDFSIEADDPILVAGYMLGCTATGVFCPGDPYMVLMVPVEQYQSDYVFLVDTSYDEDFAKLVRPTGAQIDVACLGVVPENRWTAVGQSGYDWATIDMNPGEANCAPGTNEASGDAAFGIIVSGQSYAASYAYPGGLGLETINPQ